LTEREEKVDCKGKGMMTTFWCDLNSVAGGSLFSASEASHGADITAQPEDGHISDAHEAKQQRLVEWNMSIFASLLREIVSSRPSHHKIQENEPSISTTERSPIDEIQDEISFRMQCSTSDQAVSAAEVSDMAIAQLRELITCIARSYRNNPFHNFDHCSHVVLSTKKLLNRIKEREKEVQHETKNTTSLTFGITSDPLAQFGILFAALIHDMDHPGVSNAQLTKEDDPLAHSYNGQSVAEQNSIDAAWKLLKRPQFVELRRCICATKEELSLFRQTVVNVVMATDLFDKSLKSKREHRWNMSFVDQCTQEQASLDLSLSKRRAAVVIDLIIQASDVSHTMQHFTVYKKWNMKLLTEMYAAYQNGRMDKDPTEGWYEGELWFFDNYVIPLAQKLRECHVFGVSCDEFLDYAKDNRMEWEAKGRDIVQMAKVQLGAVPTP
jgi:3'5'-cyclic nucleotide phosphodiesterase